MAEAVTPEVVEANFTRVEALATRTANLTAVICDSFNAHLAVLNARLDAIEGKIAQINSDGGCGGYKSSPPTRPAFFDIVIDLQM
jgi:hypothetical protein